jgi:pimeloyl-ACP methyl ester carboxylesterase
MVVARIPHLLFAIATILVALASPPAWAQFSLDPANPKEAVIGPTAAKGAVVWSHGRSVNSEDSRSPTPPYLATLRQAGWDTFRFNRMRDSDYLQDSARELVRRVDELKQRGYRRIVLAGQSYGAFLSLMAADASDDVHAVIATAPAAYGSFADFYDSWRSNATQLYPLLETIRHARVMLFFFHGDDFDPGGRGDRSKTILAAHNIDNLVVDQPPLLTTHWAATTDLFVRRFAGCIRDFIEAEAGGAVTCSSAYGNGPDQLVAFRAQFHAAADTASGGVSGGFAGKWRGNFGDGRAVALDIDRGKGDEVTATYTIGAGSNPPHHPERIHRIGHIVGDEIVFGGPPHAPMHCRLRADSRLEMSLQPRGSGEALGAILRRVETTATP